MRYDDARQGEWDELITKLRGLDHEIGEAVHVAGDTFLVRVPVDNRLCTFPEAQELLRQDEANLLDRS